MGLFRKGKTRITAKFHRVDLVICSHSTERKTKCYSQINMVGRLHEREKKNYYNIRQREINKLMLHIDESIIDMSLIKLYHVY